MAALPLEAFTEQDPPVEDPAFYYPPGQYMKTEIAHCTLGMVRKDRSIRRTDIKISVYLD